MKPIEPGCLALYTGTHSEKGFGPGSCVTVIRERSMGADHCSGCQGSHMHWFVDGLPPIAKTACGNTLIRIDGDPDEVEKLEEVEA